MELKNCLRAAFTAGVLCMMTVFTAGVPLACRLTEEGIEIVSAEMTVPKILSFSVEDNSNLVMVCSSPVSVERVRIKSEDGEYVEENSAADYSQNGTQVNFLLKEPTKVGVNYVLTGLIKDSGGNELSFSLPFSGFNENPARLVLSEVRSKHSTSKGVLKKCEFVEVYVLKGGSTAGLEIVAGSDGDAKKYVFPDINVKTGEFITVHFRTVGDGDCIDELGANLELSTGTDSSPARDLWVEGTETRISDSDVVVIRDSCRNLILDGVLFSAEGKQSWYYAGQKALALEAFETGVWKGGWEPKDAVAADGISLTRTISRLNLDSLTLEFSEQDFTEDFVLESGVEDWALVEGATPGAENSTKIYVK
ncbi:hypothetical protein [uncultured Treponema sp.]|uniref:hypothetical protein n=1 Tax=uncultured Treponema sp. TaxID=162155 RepID=UPI0015BE72D5|nr:hypothetical protein [uncultured Treponema sp.]